MQNFNGEDFYGFDDLLDICQLIVEMLWSENLQLFSF